MRTQIEKSDRTAGKMDEKSEALQHPPSILPHKLGLSVISGSILTIPTDGLITNVNSIGNWWGAIDGLLQNVTPNVYEELAAAMPLRQGAAHIYRASNSVPFRNVVFVVDDSTELRPCREVVVAGLSAAEEHGLTSVTIPSLRMGVLLGRIEKTKEETCRQYALGVSDFLAKYPNSSLKITFVIFNDQEVENLVECALREQLLI